MASSSVCELQNDLGHNTDAPLDKLNEGNLQHKCTNSSGEHRLDINTKDCDSEKESRSCPDSPDSGTRIQTETLTPTECGLEVKEQAASGPEADPQSDTSSEEKLKENATSESGSEIANPAESSPEVSVQASPVQEIGSYHGSELKTNALVGDARADNKLSSLADKRKERLRRIYDLRLRKNEARKLNHVEVVEEDKRNKRPANWEARKRKVEWEVAEEEARKQAELDGEDYDKIKMLETSSLELERKERKNWKKKNPDKGFSDFAQAQHRQYERLTKQMEPDMVAYMKTKQEMGESFYPGVNTLIHGAKPSETAVNRMVDDLEKQIEKRSKFSRRRALNEDADVDYINDRNMRFNKKAARFYDQYTTEVKQNLERGTAV